jgi:YtoQ family protein
MTWQVYLSGEIHTDWRDQIINGCEAAGLDIIFTSAVTNHDASDAAGDCFGGEDKSYWRDQKSAKVNAIRTKKSIEECDMAVIRFGDKYKQWNAAFDAGYCAALGRPYITLHGESIVHPLKEVDGSAQAWATTPSQIVEMLAYLLTNK